jgi:hypothetical protein
VALLREIESPSSRVVTCDAIVAVKRFRGLRRRPTVQGPVRFEIGLGEAEPRVDAAVNAVPESGPDRRHSDDIRHGQRRPRPARERQGDLTWRRHEQGAEMVLARGELHVEGSRAFDRDDFAPVHRRLTKRVGRDLQDALIELDDLARDPIAILQGQHVDLVGGRQPRPHQ